jgi:hypothetical protein
MKKNVAGQSIGAEMVTAVDGSAFTGAVTAYYTIDNGTQTIGSVGSGICTHEGNGYHSYAPIAAETNGNHIAWTFIGTGAVPATIQVYTGFPQSVDNDVANQSILAQVTGTGNRAVTIHIQDALAAPIADVLVRIGTASIYTDPSGNAVFALDDGIYSVYLRKAFVTFTVPESLTVAGDGTYPFTGAIFAPSVPTQPNTCVVYGYVIDNGGDPVVGADIFINETDDNTFSNTQKVVLNKQTTSDATGLWELEIIRSSELVPATSSYEASITNDSTGFRKVYEITVPDADSAEFSTIIDS